MKLSKTAAGILSAKYRAVLIRCLLACLTFFPNAANALDVSQNMSLAENMIDDDKIVFSNNATLDGNNHIFGKTDNNLSITGVGTLKDITLDADKNIEATGKLNIDGKVVFNGPLTVNQGASLTLTDNATMKIASNMSMNLYGDFHGDLETSELKLYDGGSFSGKITGHMSVYTEKSVFDPSRLQLSEGSTIESLNLYFENGSVFDLTRMKLPKNSTITLLRLYFEQNSAINLSGLDLSGTGLVLNNQEGNKYKAHVDVFSDLSADSLIITDNVNGEIDGHGTGTLRTGVINVSSDSSASFKNIKIAALSDSLKLNATNTDFDNVAISAGKTITFNSADFNGNSFLTAKQINVKDSLNLAGGTLTVNGILESSSIIGGGYIERRSARSGGDFPDYHGERKQCHADA